MDLKGNIVPQLVDMESWVCCQCGYTNELSDVCEYCEHERCVYCEHEEDEDLDDFIDLIIIDEPEG